MKLTHDQAVSLLRIRHSLTGQGYNDHTADTWAEALGDVPFERARSTIIDLARTKTRVEFGDVYQAANPHRHPAEQRAPLEPERTLNAVPPERGRVIAWHACVDELTRRGRTRADAERRASELLRVWLPAPSATEPEPPRTLPV